jgi:aflatoxin B1 aldehyde reductase
MARRRIILGLMNIGPDPAKGARITSKDEFAKILDSFQGHGFDEVDTAQMYLEGEQERWTGEMNWAGRGLKLATKVGPSIAIDVTRID